jgi:hypothetical protein
MQSKAITVEMGKDEQTHSMDLQHAPSVQDADSLINRLSAGLMCALQFSLHFPDKVAAK